jgi:hypothetical protein
MFGRLFPSRLSGRWIGKAETDGFQGREEPTVIEANAGVIVWAWIKYEEKLTQ